MTERIVWQGVSRDYDDCSHTEIYEDPLDAFKAAGLIREDGTAKWGPNTDHSWDVEPHVLVPAGGAIEDEPDLEELRLVTYLSIYYVPALIQKYNDGGRLNAHEQQVLGLRPPDEKVRWPR